MSEPSETSPRRRLERNLGLAAMGLLVVGCLVVLRPFFSGLVWAVVLCFSTWPIYERLLGGLRGRRTLAAFTMSVGMIVVLLLPFVVIGASLADSVKELTGAVRAWIDEGPPEPPAWLGRLPVIGGMALAQWKELAAGGAGILKGAQGLLEPVGEGLLRVGLMLGRGVLDIALSIFVSFFLFRDGAEVAARLRTGVERLGGARGGRMLDVAGKTIRGVVYGILGTAVVQAVMAGVGFALAGVPGAAFLALLIFFVSVIPGGPPLIWVPAAIWLFHRDQIGWGIFMLIWGVGVSSIDNFVRPWLISHGSAMPFILIFFGVLGGVITFGFIGVFLGPILLAVGYRLTEEWISLRRSGSTADSADPLTARDEGSRL